MPEYRIENITEDGCYELVVDLPGGSPMWPGTPGAWSRASRGLLTFLTGLGVDIRARLEVHRTGAYSTPGNTPDFRDRWVVHELLLTHHVEEFSGRLLTTVPFHPEETLMEIAGDILSDFGYAETDGDWPFSALSSLSDLPFFTVSDYSRARGLGFNYGGERSIIGVTASSSFRAPTAAGVFIAAALGQEAHQAHLESRINRILERRSAIREEIRAWCEERAEE